MAGGSMKEILASPPLLWTATVKWIAMAGIVSGMAFMHESGLIDRSLKPSNVLLDGNRWPQLCNFDSGRTPMMAVSEYPSNCDVGCASKSSFHPIRDHDTRCHDAFVMPEDTGRRWQQQIRSQKMTKPEIFWIAAIRHKPIETLRDGRNESKSPSVWRMGLTGCL